MTCELFSQSGKLDKRGDGTLIRDRRVGKVKETNFPLAESYYHVKRWGNKVSSFPQVKVFLSLRSIRYKLLEN